MATTTMKLPFTRFVRQVSNGAARSKYAYQAMMKENALALETAPWREATCAENQVTLTVNAVAATDGEFDAETGKWTSLPSYKQYMRDGYDAFKQGGDAVPALATMCGYAGMAAYRFKIPDSASNVALSSISLVVARDRYCLSGVRVAVVLSNEATPNSTWATWDVVRGNGTGAIVSPHQSSDSEGVASWGFLAQSDVPFLTASRPAEGTLELKATDFAGLAVTGKAYLWVFLSIEDYADWWGLYDARTARYYSIEGSAMLMAGNCTFTFADSASRDDSYWAKLYSITGAGAFSPALFMPDETSGASVSRTQAQAEAIKDNVCSVFGETFVGLCSAESIATVPGTGNVSEDVGRLLSFAKLPREKMLTTGAGAWADVRSLPPSDLGKFALNKFDVDILPVGSSSNYFFRHIGGSKGDQVFGARLDLGSTVWAIDSSGSNPTVSATGYSRLKLFTGILTVPAGCQEYHGIYVSANKTVLSGHEDWDLGGANIWLVDSKSAMGPWRDVAIGAVLSYQGMFSTDVDTVSASAEGDGSYTDGITVSATAKKIAYVPYTAFTDESGHLKAFRAQTDIAIPPGAVILVAPCVAPALTGIGVAGEVGGKEYQSQYEIDNVVFYPNEVRI